MRTSEKAISRSAIRAELLSIVKSVKPGYTAAPHESTEEIYYAALEYLASDHAAMLSVWERYAAKMESHKTASGCRLSDSISAEYAAPGWEGPRIYRRPSAHGSCGSFFSHAADNQGMSEKQAATRSPEHMAVMHAAAQAANEARRIHPDRKAAKAAASKAYRARQAEKAAS